MKLLLATHNEHKRREFARLLADDGDGDAWRLQSLPESVELPPEDGETFAENALGKARAAATGTGRASIADDSGIEAAALGGAPGVRSARYAGEDASDRENLDKLLAEAPAGSALRVRVRDRLRRSGARPGACVRGALRGDAERRPARRARLWL